MDLEKLGSTRPSLCFNFDGGPPDELVSTVIGTERFNIHIEGIAAHAGARPEQGVSATTIASVAIAELEHGGWNGRIERTEGSGSANVGTLEGGTGTNVVMPRLHILAEARSHSPTFRHTIITTLREAVERAVSTIANSEGNRGHVTFSAGPTYEPFSLPEDAPVIRAVEEAARRCHIDTRLVTNDGGMDANWIVAHGIPTVTLGVGQSNAHTPEERLDLGRFRRACKIATTLARIPAGDQTG
jgi:tripeptide aminopeptidase